jgi:zinc protease
MTTARLFTRIALAAALTGVLAGVSAASDVSIYNPKSLPVPPIGHVPAVTPERIALPNGVVLYLLENHDLPVVKGTAYFRSSPTFELADRAGLLSVTGDVIRTGGTATHTGDWLDDHLSNIGASLNSNVTNELANAGFRCLAENTAEVVGLWADLVRHPAFPDDKIELAKVGLRQSIASRNDEMFTLLFRTATQAVYGKDSPWAHEPEYATIEPITAADCRRVHAGVFVPERMIVAVYGDFRSADMKRLLLAKLGDWKKSGTPAPVLPPTPASVQPKLFFAPKEDVTQSGIIVAQPGSRADDADYASLQVLEQGLGGGFASRLMNHIRTQRGLAYAAGARAGSGFARPGVFMAYTLTKSESTMVALGLLRDDVRAVTQAPFTNEELQNAQQAVVNGFVFNFEDPSQVLFRAAYYETVGYPADFLQKYQKALDGVTGQSVLEAAKRKITPDRQVVIVVGKESDFADPLTSAGLPVERVDISIPPPPSAHGEVAATPEAKARGRQWLEGAVTAAGGSAAWAAVRTLTQTMESTIQIQGQSISLSGEESWRLPDHRVEKQKLPFGEVTQGFDGTAGWTSAMGQVQDDPKAAADLAQELERSLWIIFANPAKVELVALDAPETVAGVAYRAAIVPGAKTTDLTYLFAEDGGLAGFAYQDAGQGAQMGPARVAQIYGGWSAEGALKLPHTVSVTRDGKPFLTGKVTSVKLNPELSDEMFKKPAK